MGFKIEYGDITNFKGDAIINSLGTDTVVYGKLCDSIVKANDDPALPLFLKSINGKANVLDCYITESPHLSVTHIIHIVTPYNKSDYNYLKYIVAYIKLLNLARDNKLYRIGVPLIGTGSNGYSHKTCKSIVEAMCKAYVSYYPEMDITVFHHGTKSIPSKKPQSIQFDIDELKDLIMKYKTETVSTGSIYTLNFTKDLFLNPPKISEESIDNEKRRELLRQQERDDFHPTVEFTSQGSENCIGYVSNYMNTRYFPKELSIEKYEEARAAFKQLSGGGRYGKSALGHLSEDINHSKATLLKVAIACKMNTEETEQLLNIYGWSTVTLTNREQAIYAFITQKLYDVDKIEELLNNSQYKIANLSYF